MARQATTGRLRVKTSRRILLWAATVLVALTVFWVRDALAVLFWGGLLAYILSPAVSALVDRGVRRPVAVILVFAALAGLLFFAGRVVIPAVALESSRIAGQLPAWSQRLQGVMGSLSRWRQSLTLPPTLDRALTSTLQSAEKNAVAGLGSGFRALFRMLPGLFNLVIAPVAAAYLLLEAPRLTQGVLQFFPPVYRPHVRELFWRLDMILGGFLRGQILVALVVGVLAGVTVTFFGLGYGLLIGIIAGVTEVVPYVGPVIGAIPAVLLALMRSPEEALWVALSFFAIHQAEGGFLSPAIVGQEMGLKPLAILLALFVGGEAGGLLGLVLAVPAMGAAVVFTRWAWNLLTVPPAFR